MLEIEAPGPDGEEAVAALAALIVAGLDAAEGEGEGVAEEGELRGEDAPMGPGHSKHRQRVVSHARGRHGRDSRHCCVSRPHR